MSVRVGQSWRVRGRPGVRRWFSVRVPWWAVLFVVAWEVVVFVVIHVIWLVVAVVILAAHGVRLLLGGSR